MRAPIGIKLRTRRKSRGITQAELARDVGISPSYLNLIESSKRDIGGALLARIAARLEIGIEELTGEREQRLLDALHEMLSDPIFEGVRIGADTLRELVARFPAMAQSMHRLYRGYADSNTRLEAFANRLKSDPLLSSLLHQVLSHVTAVRSSGEILRNVSDLSPAEQTRFLQTIDREARKLSDLARAVTAHFDQSMNTRTAVSPVREVDDLIIGENNYFPQLEDAARELRLVVERMGAFGEASLAQALDHHFSITIRNDAGERPDTNGFPAEFGFDSESRTMWFRDSAPSATRQFQLTRLLAELMHGELIAEHMKDERLSSASAQRVAYRALASYLAGAAVFPYSRFLQDAEAQGYDVDRLRRSYSASFEQVAHRLVTLRRPDEAGIAFGFLRADPAGRLTKHFPLPGLQLSNSGHACPLWVIYAVARNSGQTLRQVVSFPDGARYLFLGRATAKGLASYHAQPFHSSVMLACDILQAHRTVYARGLDFDEPSLAVPVGPTCRLCIRRECVHRQEEALDVFGENPDVRLPLVARSFETSFLPVQGRARDTVGAEDSDPASGR